jgi:hypothetical protein
MSEESATAICRHEGCDKRFTLSRYGNRTYTSERRRKSHLFCSPRCRKAHSRRLAAIRGGVTESGLVTPAGPIPQGGVTSPKIIEQNQEPLTPKITTEHPRSEPSRASIVETELGRWRDWERIESTDGVVSYATFVGKDVVAKCGFGKLAVFRELGLLYRAD